MKNNTFYTNKTVSYIMSNRNSTDIDTKKDLENCIKILKNV